MSSAENESTKARLTAELERLQSLTAEGSDEAIKAVAQVLKKLGTKLGDVVPSTQWDAVLFDVGGVMLTNGWDHNERAELFTQFHLDKATFEARHPEPYDALERDTISMSDYLKATVFYEPRPFTEAEFIEAMKAVSVPIPSNAIGILGEIAASDKYLVGVLNNESRLLHEYRMEKYDLAQHLDIQLASCYVGMRKPDLDIYRRAVDIVGRPAGRIVFIDDRKGNCDAAAAVGIHAIQFLGEEKLRFDLQQIGIL